MSTTSNSTTSRPSGENNKNNDVDNNHDAKEYIRSCTLVEEDGITTTEDIRYVIRGLKDDNEIHHWANFCASVFAYKTNPPSSHYFERHYFNDPNRGNPSLIRVAFYKNEMVASCRVFLRNLSTGLYSNTTTIDTEVDAASSSSSSSFVLRAGGIGEVCTANAHRRRGLSKVLLQDAIRIMTLQKLQISVLHAAPSFFPVYEKTGGYSCTTSEWSVVSISWEEEKKKEEKDDVLRLPPSSSSSSQQSKTSLLSIRAPIFPKDVPRLQSLHCEYSERRFAGCIVRSKEYWNDYLSKELEDTIWVLEKNHHETVANENEKDGVIVAWLSLRERGGRYQLREFGMDSQYVTEQQVLEVLLPHALSSLLKGNHKDDEKKTITSINLILPTVVLDPIRPNNEESERKTTSKGSSSSTFCIDWSSETTENEMGWMYLTLPSSSSSSNIPTSMETILNYSGNKHLIWPSDSF